MRRQTTESMNRGTDTSDLTTGNAVWETPPLVFEKLNQDFGPFAIDLTADAQRHLCPIWFGPDSPVGELDALKALWSAHGTNGFSNPPYGPFVQRLLLYARATAAATGFTSTLLLPMRVTDAFKKYVLVGASQLLFCDSRLTFFENGVPRLNDAKFGKRGKKGQLLKVPTDPAMFDSIIVRFGPKQFASVSTGIWHVPKHVTADDLARAVERRQQSAPATEPVDLMAALKTSLLSCDACATKAVSA